MGHVPLLPRSRAPQLEREETPGAKLCRRRLHVQKEQL